MSSSIFTQILSSPRPADTAQIHGDTTDPVRGYAWMAFYDARFTLPDIIGRSLIIHENRDDFTTQPSGDSGTKIACGAIEVYIP